MLYVDGWDGRALSALLDISISSPCLILKEIFLTLVLNLEIYCLKFSSCLDVQDWMGEFLGLVSRLKRCFSLTSGTDLRPSLILIFCDNSFDTFKLWVNELWWGAAYYCDVLMMNDNSIHCLASLYNPIQKWLVAEKMHIQHLIVKNYKLWLALYISRIYHPRINRSNQESVSYKNLTGSLMRNSKILNLSFSTWIEIHSGVKNLRHIIKKLYLWWKWF